MPAVPSDMPPEPNVDELAETRAAVRAAGDVLVTVGKLQAEMVLYREDQKAGFNRIDRHLTNIDQHLGRLNTRTDKHSDRLGAVEDYQAQHEQQRREEAAFARGRATALVTRQGWRVFAGALGLLAAVASGIGAVVAIVVAAAQ